MWLHAYETQNTNTHSNTNTFMAGSTLAFSVMCPTHFNVMQCQSPNQCWSRHLNTTNGKKLITMSITKSMLDCKKKYNIVSSKEEAC